MTRRGHGEGSVYRFRNGWAAQITLSEPGEPRRRKMLLGKTQAEVLGKMRDARRLLEQGMPIDTGRLTVGAYLEQWLTSTLPASNVRASTIDSYSSNARLHIIPTLGRVELVKLKAPQVRGWLLELASKLSGRQPKPPAEGPPPAPLLLSTRTIAYQHAILRAALGDAVRDELIPRNVALLVEPPRARRVEVEPLSEAEARLLTAAARDRHAALWLTMLGLGLRRGEALALRWDDLDLDAGTIAISRQLRRQRGDVDPDTGRRRGQLLELPVKTDGSATTLAVPASLVDTLRVHRAQQLVARLAAPVWHDPGLVFTTSLGTWIEPRNVNRAWQQLCDRAGVRRMKLHTLRHSTASFLLAQGTSMKAIQETLRHTRMATTSDVYAHLLEPVRRDAADAMDGVLRDLPGT